MNTLPMGAHYELFVDGSPGPKKESGKSGWGVVLMAGNTPIYESCGFTKERITTNAIELEALIQGLAYLVRQNMPHMVTVWTDSLYTAETVARLPFLHAADYCDEKGNPVKNKDRIRLIYDLLHTLEASSHCIIRKTKGHDGHLGNELADVLSKKAAYESECYYKINRTIINEPTEEKPETNEDS